MSFYFHNFHFSSPRTSTESVTTHLIFGQSWVLLHLPSYLLVLTDLIYILAASPLDIAKSVASPPGRAASVRLAVDFGTPSVALDFRLALSPAG